MIKRRKYILVGLMTVLSSFLQASADVLTEKEVHNLIGQSLDMPHQQILKEQPRVLKPILPLRGANFVFKGENATTWGPIHLATTAQAQGFGAETRGGMDRLLPPAQILFLLEHALDNPTSVRSFDHDEANELSARGIAAYFVEKGEMDTPHAARFIEVVTKCMRTRENDAYKTPEDAAFCHELKAAPGEILKGVIGFALLEEYTRVQARRVLSKYTASLPQDKQLLLKEQLRDHLGPLYDESLFAGNR
jgi:hypothetical protein